MHANKCQIIPAGRPRRSEGLGEKSGEVIRTGVLGYRLAMTAWAPETDRYMSTYLPTYST